MIDLYMVQEAYPHQTKPQIIMVAPLNVIKENTRPYPTYQETVDNFKSKYTLDPMPRKLKQDSDDE